MPSIPLYTPKQILCPIDMSPLSDLALKYAYLGARLFGAHLTILHAMHFDYPRYLSEELMARVLEELDHARHNAQQHLMAHAHKVLGLTDAEVPLRFVARDIAPVEAVLQTAEEEKADLVVMGTHGHGGLRHWMLGSVTENVLHASKAPVFTVRQKVHGFIDTTQAQSRPRIDRILCPCNLTVCAAQALQAAASLSIRFKAGLSVLLSLEEENSQTENRFDDWLKDHLGTEIPFKKIVRQGEPTRQIIAVAAEQQSDLIVMGIRHRPLGQATMVGGTSERVARLAPAPVLSVPHYCAD